jgi:hypothetical protein
VAVLHGLRRVCHRVVTVTGLLRGLSGARVEIGLATMAYNIKRMTNVLGAASLTEALHRA